MTAVPIVFPVLALGVVGLIFLVTRRWSRSINRAIKAHQDLARAVVDLADRMERLEKKPGEHKQAKP